MVTSASISSVSMDFLEQMDMGRNAFTRETAQSLSKADIFYELEDIPKPISSSRASVLTLSQVDFPQIEREFKIKYVN